MIVSCANTIVFAQNPKRQDNETAEAFVTRLKPDTIKFAHKLIETGIWSNASKAILVFWGHPANNETDSDFDEINGHLYIPIGQNNYRDVEFGFIGEDGGFPQIISVFFANADKDSAKELFVLCKYPQRHYDYGGEFYETFIYDNPAAKTQRLTYLSELSEKFWGCECAWREEAKRKPETAKFKTAREIIIGLKKMGF